MSKFNTAKFFTHINRNSYIEGNARKVMMRTVHYAEDKDMSLEETKRLLLNLFENVGGISAADIDMLEVQEGESK